MLHSNLRVLVSKATTLPTIAHAWSSFVEVKGICPSGKLLCLWNAKTIATITIFVWQLDRYEPSFPVSCRAPRPMFLKCLAESLFLHSLSLALFTSVTRRLNYFSIFGHAQQQLKAVQKHYNFAKVGLKICQTLTKINKMLPKCRNFTKSSRTYHYYHGRRHYHHHSFRLKEISNKWKDSSVHKRRRRRRGGAPHYHNPHLSSNGSIPQMKRKRSVHGNWLV